ncbi:MAG TPA: hypothetical protein VG253_02795 [Streptosporangiaceae bacterium]|jgi:hypothetical protein|nr:hypothetical protein [Streptosporangiaceae bacterium]
MNDDELRRRLARAGGPTLALAGVAAIIAALAACGTTTSARTVQPTGTVPSASAAPTSTVTTAPTTTTAGKGVVIYADCTAPGNRPSVEPGGIVLACADNGEGLESMTWSAWTATSAVGVGTVYYKPCKPNCAEGGIRYISGVHVTLSAPLHASDGVAYFSRITLSKAPPGSPTSTNLPPPQT